MNLDVTNALAASIPSMQTQVGTAVLSMNLDTLETMGDSMTKMIEQSVTPHLGQSIDIRL